MIITAKEKRDQLKKEIPWATKNETKQIWLVDTKFKQFTIPYLKDVVRACSIAHLPFIPDVRTCNNYGLKLHTNVEDLQIALFELGKDLERTSYDFGFVLGVHNFYGPHCSNIAGTTEGLRYIEPQEDEITETYNGKIYFTFF